MAEYSNELIAKLKKAKSLEEISGLLRAECQDEKAAERLWKELQMMHEDEGKELSMDELESVAGGVKRRDWLKDGCEATVEPDSDCWHTDGGCWHFNIEYSNPPQWCGDQLCPICGGYIRPCGEITKQCRIHGRFTIKIINLWEGTWEWDFLDMKKD